MKTTSLRVKMRIARKKAPDVGRVVNQEMQFFPQKTRPLSLSKTAVAKKFSMNFKNYSLSTQAKIPLTIFPDRTAFNIKARS